MTALLHRSDTGGSPTHEALGVGGAHNRADVAPARVEEVLPTLRVELDVLGATCRLTMHGALCSGSLAPLTALVDQLGCIPCDRVVIDMRPVTQLDQAGANVILGLYYYVLGRGGELRVTALEGEVADALRAVSDGLLDGVACGPGGLLGG